MLSIDEAIAHAREVAKEKRKEMQCKTCKLFAKSDLHPLQGYCRKNKFRSIEIDSWRKVCSEYVPKEMCKCAEEHEQLAEWLEELKALREEKSEFLIYAKDIAEANYEMGMEIGYKKAIDDAKSVILQTLDNEIMVDTLHLRLEQLKERNKE